MPTTTGATILCRLRGYPVPDTPEERVRQRVVDELFALGYPWHLWRCEVSHPQLGRDAGRADLVMGLLEAKEGGTAQMIIECKAQPPTTADAAQVAAYARAFRADLWALTDGLTWRVWRRNSDAVESAFPAFSLHPRQLSDIGHQLADAIAGERDIENQRRPSSGEGR